MWSEGKATPWLPDERLRKLPGDYVTKDINDPVRAHESDEDYIVSNIVDDRRAAEKNPGVPKETVLPVYLTEDKKLSANKIDEVRLRVMLAFADTQKRIIREGGEPDKRPKHVWFPEDNVNAYELRTGNAPADGERPAHLRGYDLHMDIWSGELPKTIKHRLMSADMVNLMKGSQAPGII